MGPKLDTKHSDHLISNFFKKCSSQQNRILRRRIVVLDVLLLPMCIVWYRVASPLYRPYYQRMGLLLLSFLVAE